jgi:hypothetical protein
MQNHRLTSANYKMPCSVILGYEKLCSGFALCTVLSAPQFFVPVKCCAFFLIGHKKPSVSSNVKRKFFYPALLVAPRHPWRGEFVKK